jgi:tetratricopeptide (TPR) repeat protein
LSGQPSGPAPESRGKAEETPPELGELLKALELAVRASDNERVVVLATRLLDRRDLAASALLTASRARAGARAALHDTEGALSDWNAVVACDSAGAGDWHHRGIALFHAAQHLAAAASFEKAAAIAPSCATHAWRAAALFSAGALEPARAAIDEALGLDPYDVNALQWRAYLRSETEDDEGAIEDLTLAISRALKKGPLHRARAIVFDRLNRHPEAVRDFAEFLRTNPDDLDARGRLAELRKMTGDAEGAIEEYGRLIERSPGNFEARLARIDLLCAVGRTAAAVADGNEAVALHPEIAAAYHVSARACRLDGDPDRALAAINSAIRLEPDTLDFAAERVSILIDRGDKPAAIDALGPLIRQRWQDAELRFKRGELRSELAQWRPAIDDFDFVIRAEPDRARGWMARAYAHVGLGKPYLALGDIRHALRISPDDPTMLVLKGDVCAERGQIEAAFAAYTRALSAAPDHLESLFHRARLSLQLGRIEDALADHDRMLWIDPGNARLLGMRGRLHFILGDFALARDDFEAARESIPFDADRDLWSYFAQMRAGDPGSVAFPDPDGWPGVIVRFVTGQATEEEIKALAAEHEHSTGRTGASAQAAFYLAEFALRKGRTDRAAALFREAEALAAQAQNAAIRHAARAELSQIAESSKPLADRNDFSR